MLVSDLQTIAGYVHPTAWKIKPNARETIAINNEIPQHPVTLTIEQWADAAERGRTMLPSVLNKPLRRAENVAEQQLFFIDVDDATNALSPSVTVNALRDHGINPAIVYHSMSSTLDAPRYRVIVATAMPAVGRVQIAAVYAALLAIVKPAPDMSSGDLSRMFFGASSTYPLPVRRLWKLQGGNGEAPTVQQIIEAAPAQGEAAYNGAARKQDGKRRNKADEYLISNIDLLAYVRKMTGERGKREGNTVKFHKCPVCGHFDHFIVTPDPHGVDLWMCWGSHGLYADGNGVMRHPGGTIVDLMLWTEGGDGDDA